MEEQAPARPVWRFRLGRRAAWLGAHLLFGLSVEGRERLPAGAAVLCFNHASWTDPIFLLAALPARPRTQFFGPAQRDMRVGFRNAVMRWLGTTVPYRPDRRGMVAAMRRVEALLAAGERLAIAGEGRIHAGEANVLPLEQGPAYMALRFGVPLVPVAVNGTTWLALRRRVRVRFGEPVSLPTGVEAAEGDATDDQVGRLTEILRSALLDLVSDFPDPAPSRGFGAWLTELFNDWPEGSRPPVPPRDGEYRPG